MQTSTGIKNFGKNRKNQPKIIETITSFPNTNKTEAPGEVIQDIILVMLLGLLLYIKALWGYFGDINHRITYLVSCSINYKYLLKTTWYFNQML